MRDGVPRLPGRRRAARGLAAVITVLHLGVSAESAGAGTYVMRSCDVPGHAKSEMAPWFSGTQQPGVAIVDMCASGGGIAFTFDLASQMPGNSNVNIAIARPLPPRSSITFVKLVLWYAARLSGTGGPLNFHSFARWSDEITPGLSNGPPGSENLVAEQQLNTETETVQVGIQCGPLGGGPTVPDPCVPANSIPLLIRGIEVTLREDVPPTISLRGGALLESGPQSGVRSLTFTATDLQSGLAKVDVLLDDKVVATDDLASRCFHSDFTVCPTSDDGTLTVDTRLVPNGSYNLALRARDAAGNERVARVERAVVVANETPQDAKSVLPYSIVANFKGSSRSSLTVPYGRRVTVRGRVMQGTQPAADTRIEVLERLDRRGARERSTRSVMTRADGSFSIGLATSRPSRVVRLAHRPAGGVSFVSRALKLRVRALSRVRATLRGSVVRFSGRVLSGPMPKGGKRVQMEGRSPDSAWTLFKNLRTDKRGRFSGTYRLRVRRPGIVLKIRAIVPSEAGYGYLGSRSRGVSLRVR